MTLESVDLTSLSDRFDLGEGTIVSLIGPTEALAISNGPLLDIPATEDEPILIMSTGLALDVTGENVAGDQGTDLGIEGGINDDIVLTLDLIKPESANTFGFDFTFLSEEFPEFLDRGFNDFFSVLIDGVEVAVDVDGTAISIINTFFDPALSTAGTIFDGRTDTLRITTPIDINQEEVEVQLRIADEGDGLFDSAAFISGFAFTNNTVFIDFDEGDLTFDSLLASDLTFSLPAADLTEAEKDGILDYLQDTFAAFRVTFTRERPDFPEFSTIHVGGSIDDVPDFLTPAESIISRSEGIDIGNEDASDNAFVLSEDAVEVLDGPTKIDLIQQAIAREAGHLFGLRNIDDRDSFLFPLPGESRVELGGVSNLGATANGVSVISFPQEQDIPAELTNNLGVDVSTLLPARGLEGEISKAFTIELGVDAPTLNDVRVAVVDPDGNILDIFEFDAVGPGEFAHFVAPAIEADSIVAISKSTAGGDFDLFLAPEGTESFSLDGLSENDVFGALGISVADFARGEFKIIGASDAATSDISAAAFTNVAGDPISFGSRLADDFSAGVEDDAPGAALIGLGGDDTLTGGAGGDQIYGGEGDDIAEGGGGDDDLRGAAGDDTLTGGDGNDTISGGAGENDLSGGAGDDEISSTDGNDTLFGGDGDDTIIGGAGDNDVSGGAGNNVLSSTDGDDTLTSGDGDDTISSGAGNDIVMGGAGNNLLSGGDGEDTLTTEDGDDTINGGEGADLLTAGAGDDEIAATLGDTVDGGDDFDTVTIDAARGDLVFSDGGDVVAVFTGDGGEFRVSNAELLVFTDVTLNEDGINNLFNPEEEIIDLSGDDLFIANDVDDAIRGGLGDDTIVGEGGANKLSGEEGDDSLSGLAGNDTLFGNVGDDRLSGGDGDDEISGGEGNDTVAGGDGADAVDGGAGNDDMNGGDGDDSLVGGSGDDVVSAGDGADTVSGDSGDDDIDGGAGDDRLTGGLGRDNLNGGSGDDTLDGSTGSDQLNGGGGNDLLAGGDGSDAVAGGAGDDTMSGDGGDDVLNGGDGADAVSSGAGRDTVEGGAGNDGISGGGDQDSLSGGAGADTVNGDEGADTITGGDGADLLRGGQGADFVTGGADDDTLRGENGADLLVGNRGSDRLIGGADSDTLKGGGDDDTLRGGGGRDDLIGGFGDDRLRSGGGDDALNGGGGSDNARSGGGDDQIRGGGGADDLHGGGGADTINGGRGDDALRGGIGADIFEFRTNDGDDTIRDFQQGLDKIRILRGAEEFSDLDIDQVGASTVISFSNVTITVERQNADNFTDADFIF